MAKWIFYSKFKEKQYNGEAIDWDTDTIKVALLKDTYNPDPDNHDYWDDVSSEELADGDGYTAGGKQISNPTLTITSTPSWQASTSYNVGDRVKPTTFNGFTYVCVEAGTSGSSEPTWGTTLWGLTTDGTVKWVCQPYTNILKLDADDITWNFTASKSFRYAVIYKDTGNAATSILIAYADLGATTLSGQFTLQLDAQGFSHIA